MSMTAYCTPEAMVRSSRFGQGASKAFAVLDGVQAAEILRVVRPWLDAEIDKDRTVFAQNTAHSAVPRVQVIKRIRFRVPRLACQTRKAEPTAARNVDGAVSFIGAVLTEAVHQVRGGSMGDGHERPQIHQQAAVAIQPHHPLVRPSQSDAQRMRGALPHSAGKSVVQITGTDVQPFLC